MDKDTKRDQIAIDSLAKHIHEGLTAELAFNKIDLLVDVTAGKLRGKKLIMKNPFSKDPLVQKSIMLYLEYFEVKVEKEF